MPHFTPQWLHRGEAPEDEQKIYRAWRDLVMEHGVGEDIYLHPDLALSPRETQHEPPIVYARWTTHHGTSQLSSLGVLPPRTLRIRAFPGPLGTLVVRGRRLMNNRLLGDSSAESLEHFADALRQLGNESRLQCLVLQDLDSAALLRQRMESLAEEAGLEPYEAAPPSRHWWIRFPDDPEQYWRQFSKKTRYNFRYRADHLPHTVHCVRDPRHVPTFLAKADQLTRRTWQYVKFGLGALYTPMEVAFWQRMAMLGAFRSYLLEHGGRPIAYAVGIQWKGTYVYESTGFDPEFARKSPGQVLLYRVLQDLIRCDTPRLFDFGYGDSDYKEIFANHQTLSGPVVLTCRHWRPKLAIAIDRTRRAFGRTTRTALRKAGVLSALRHFSRRPAMRSLFFSAVACEPLVLLY